MRYINLDGTLQKARRFVSGSTNIQQDEVKDPTRLAEVLRSVLKRLSDIEVTQPSEAMEFEVEVSPSAQCILNHNMHSGVRFYCVYWTHSSIPGSANPTNTFSAWADPSSTMDTLVLNCLTTGRAVIRVEPAFKAVDPARTG